MIERKVVSMKTKVTELLGTEYPIIQGGMAWVAEYHLAAAVSEAGLSVLRARRLTGCVIRSERQRNSLINHLG